MKHGSSSTPIVPALPLTRRIEHWWLCGRYGGSPLHRDDALEAWDMARTRSPGEIRASTAIRRHLSAFDAEGEIGPRRAIAALAKLGLPALEILLQIAKDEPRVRVRRWAQEALTPFTDRRIFPVLAGSLADPHMSVRLHALLALTAQRDPRATKAIIPLLRDPSGGVRVNAVAALAGVGGRAAGPALIAAAGDPQWYVRQAIATTLGVLRISGARPVLSRLLDDPRKAVRSAAQTALRCLDPRRTSKLRT